MSTKTRRDHIVQNLEKDLDMLVSARDQLFDLTARKAIGKAIEEVKKALDDAQAGIPLPPAVSRLELTREYTYEKVFVSLTDVKSPLDRLDIDLRLNSDTSVVLTAAINPTGGSEYAILNAKRDDLIFLAELLVSAVSSPTDLEGFIGQYRA